MRHSLEISIAKGKGTGGIVRCRTVPLRGWLLQRLLGEWGRIMVIVPGGSVKTLSVREEEEGEDDSG